MNAIELAYCARDAVYSIIYTGVQESKAQQLCKPGNGQRMNRHANNDDLNVSDCTRETAAK